MIVAGRATSLIAVLTGAAFLLGGCAGEKETAGAYARKATASCLRARGATVTDQLKVRGQKYVPPASANITGYLLVTAKRHQAGLLFHKSATDAKRDLKLIRARFEAVLKREPPQYRNQFRRKFDSAYYVLHNVIVAWAFPRPDSLTTAPRQLIANCLRS